MTSELRKTVSLAGHPAWVATGNDMVRRLMHDERLGITHEDPATASWCYDSPIAGPPRPSSGHDLEDHQRVRRVLSGSFGARRLERIRPRVRQIVTELLDRIEAGEQPVDLHAAISSRLPVLAWAELLGIPAADHENFVRWLDESTDIDNPERLGRGVMAIAGYIPEQIVARLAEPRDDILSDLAAAHRNDPETNSLQWVGEVAAALNFAGHLPTVSAIDDGIVLLLQHDDQRAALAADPALVEPAVEEILRKTIMTAPPGVTGVMGTPRWALEDMTVDGVEVAKGDLVIFDQWDANHDKRVYDDPERFDITRTRNPHLSFGLGVHFCVGAPLARIELQELFPALLTRFPKLRLAVPAEQLRRRHAVVTGGYAELPVSW